MTAGPDPPTRLGKAVTLTLGALTSLHRTLNALMCGRP